MKSYVICESSNVVAETDGNQMTKLNFYVKSDLKTEERRRNYFLFVIKDKFSKKLIMAQFDFR